MGPRAFPAAGAFLPRLVCIMTETIIYFLVPSWLRESSGTSLNLTSVHTTLSALSSAQRSSGDRAASNLLSAPTHETPGSTLHPRDVAVCLTREKGQSDGSSSGPFSNTSSQEAARPVNGINCNPERVFDLRPSSLLHQQQPFSFSTCCGQ